MLNLFQHLLFTKSKDIGFRIKPGMTLSSRVFQNTKMLPLLLSFYQFYYNSLGLD